MASIAAVAVLATIICLLVVTFLGVFLYHVICGQPGEKDDAEAIRKRRKTPKKHNNVNIPMENVNIDKSRRKEEQKKLKQEEKERKRQEKERRKREKKEAAARDAIEEEKEATVTRDNVHRMTTHYESLEREKQNRLSRISERSSKRSNKSNRDSRGSGNGFNYMAPNDDYAVPVKTNRGSAYSGGGSNVDKSNRTSQLARESSFRSERSGHSGIGSVSMYASSQVGNMNVGFQDDNNENNNMSPRIDEELASLRSGGSGLVKARASQWETASQVSSPRRY